MMDFLIFIALGLVGSPLKVQVLLNEKPLAHQSLQVVGFTEGQPKLDKKIITDTAGRASLDLNSKDDLNIIIQTQYQNVAYLSNILNSRRLPSKDVIIKVYPAVESDSRVQIEDLRLFFRETDNGIHVDEEIVILNPTKNTVVGKVSAANSDAPEHSNPESFRFQLPSNAFDLNFNSGFSQETTQFENNDIILTRPLPPGRTHLALKFSLERERTSLNFLQNFSLPVVQISAGSLQPNLRFEKLPFNSVPQKWLDESSAKLWSHVFKKPETKVQFSIGGLAIQYRLVEWIAPLILAFLLALIFIMRRQKPSSTQNAENSSDFEEWIRIDELEKRGALSGNELVTRKIRCLEKIIPQMSATE